MKIQNVNVKIAAGIVLYNPEVKRLEENISAIKPQVERLILVENGSANIDYLNSMDLDGVEIICNSKNEGIAYALNQICHYCKDNGFDWVLTLDQDSVSDARLVENLIPFIGKDVGIVCSHIIDRNYTLSTDTIEYDVRQVGGCFTSGSLTSIEAWERVGGFDNQMFIDMVDFDFNYLLQENGYKILQVRKATILHELGTNPRVIKENGEEILLLNRSPFRYYYVARNTVYMKRKHHIGNYKGIIMENIRLFSPILRYESNKIKNFIVFVKGTIDGFKMSIPGNRN